MVFAAKVQFLAKVAHNIPSSVPQHGLFRGLSKWPLLCLTGPDRDTFGDLRCVCAPQCFIIFSDGGRVRERKNERV